MVLNEYSYEHKTRVSILVLMDSRIKIKGLALASATTTVSILVLMDSRIKIVLNPSMEISMRYKVFKSLKGKFIEPKTETEKETETE